jgi:hypothetical protein
MQNNRKVGSINFHLQTINRGKPLAKIKQDNYL